MKNKEDKKIQLEVIGISYGPDADNIYALILQEKDGNRRIPIIIGENEAQSITMVLEGMSPQRPMTHDLFVTLCVEHSINVEKIIIYKLSDSVFHSKLICEDYNGDIREIDSRTSDAVALALRFNCPIYTYESIISESGVEMKNNLLKNDFSKCNIKELKETLEEAVKSEDYEKATIIRDLILEKRKN